MGNREILSEKPILKEMNIVKSKPSRLAGADGLRAIACLGVIFHHFAV